MSDPVQFPIEPEGEPKEAIAFQTAILQAHGGSEQRLLARVNPVCSLGYGFFEADTRSAQLARALFSADPEPGYLVPWWPFAARLTAAADAGATHLSADLSGVPIAEQGGVARFLLWRSPLDCEVVMATAVSASTVDLAAGLAGAWGAGERLVPLLAAHLSELPSSERIGPALSAGTVRFVADPVSRYRVPAGVELYAPAAYLGLDVLTTPPAAADGAEAAVRRTTALEAEAGGSFYDSQDAALGFSRPLLYQCVSRPEALAVRRFFIARLGRLVPFWMPTWDEDLTLVAPVEHGNAVLPVRDDGYSLLQFPAGVCRRHLAIRCPSGAWFYGEVGDPGDHDAGVTALELVSDGPAEDLPAGTAISFLRYCRLDSDVLEFEWSGTGYAEVKLTAVELAADTPTGALT